MVSDAKNLFLAGLGAAAMTYEKASEVISSLVKKGKITVEEGMELSQELRRDVKNTAEMTVQKVKDSKPITKSDLLKTLEDMNYATKADIIELRRMIEAMQQDQNNLD